MRGKAETVARGLGGSDAPARRRRARFQNLRRPQQKERQSAIGGGKLQPLTGFQIGLVDKARDGCDRARMQRFLHRPQRVLAVCRFRQDQPVRRKPQSIEPMTMRPAVIAQAISREDEEEGP